MTHCIDRLTSALSHIGVVPNSLMIPKDITGNINFMNEEDKKRAEETNKFVEASEDKQTGLISEFIEFIKINKKYWLIPLLIILLLMGLLILSTGSIFAPFIYTLF